MHAKIRQQPRALRQANPGRKLLALGLLLVAGGIVAMPATASGVTARSGGRITFSGAVTVPTCAMPAAGTVVSTSTASSAQRVCSDTSAANRAVYHVVTEAIPDRSGIRLLEYARDKYGNARFVTYRYD